MGVSQLRARVRPQIVDGLFYPAEREPLVDLVETLMSRSPTPRGSCFAVISPHAGYTYAGAVMASAFRAVSLKPVRRAVLIGPMHRDPIDGFFLPESAAFSTSLGDAPVDEDAVQALASSDPSFTRDDIPHLEEHCLEVQLPFLLNLFPGVSIVPILVGSSGPAAAATLARALRLTFQKAAEYTLFVVSANMASYMTGKDPETESRTLEKLIEVRDWRGILAASERRAISSCGATAIAALISMAGDDCRVEILARADSRESEQPSDQDRAPQEDRIVRYASVGFSAK